MRFRSSLFGRGLLVFSLLAAAAAVPILVAPSAHAAVVGVGAGSYRTDRPAGTTGPTNSDGAPVTPKVTTRMAGKPVPTNDWWSSLVWQRYAGNPYSENMYAHPLTFHAYNNGLGVGHPRTPVITPDTRTYEYVHTNDLRVGISSLNAPRTEVDGWGDWSVSPRWTDGTRTLRTTIAHGSPYVYAEVTGGTARVDFLGSASVFHNGGNVLGVTVNSTPYALFAPTGANWTLTGTAYATAPAGFYSVAVLPSTAALSLFTTYAYNFITDTRVSWSYNAGTGNVSATYTATTTPRQGSGSGTLTALYRHQWLKSTATVTSYTYPSPRGTMKLREGASFTTTSRFNGVLPALPLAPDADTARLRGYIDSVLAESDPFQGGNDTYWTGKALWRLAALIPVANQIGHTTARNQLIALVKARLADWLTAGAADAQRLFVHDAAWGTLIGYPASYGSDSELNDHHFHYGYYILAAAMVAQHDSTWVSSAQYGAMVKLLVRDSASTDRNDTLFPFLRYFDPYAGHSWAAGHAGFAHGNNQESSSEAMMFATAMVLFGQATGDGAMRDAGAYLYTTERDATGQYWFNKDNAVFPAAYTHRTLGILWGAGGSYATWWTANAEEIHGINMLPITGGSLYHGDWKADITDNINEMRASNGGQETEWTDVIWEFLAMADPVAAYNLWNAANPAPEWGESRGHTYHWLTSLRRWGTPEPSVTGNSATSTVLTSAAGRTYIGYNPGGAAITVTFTDGQTLAVPARAMAWRGPAGSGIEPGGGGGVIPSPSTSTPPSPSPSPTPACANPVSGSTLYLQSSGSLTSTTSAAGGVSLTSAGGQNFDGTPNNPRVFTACGINGGFTGAATTFDLFLDAGTTVANGTQVRISYDRTADGVWDRVETYRYFATDPVSGWEHYTQGQGLHSSSGALGAFSSGRIRVEVWNAIGNGSTTLGVGNRSVIRLPLS